MKIIFLFGIIILLLLIIIIFKINSLINIKYEEPEILYNKKILIVYYSNGGNTKNVAKNLHSIVGGDIEEIKLSENYPSNVFKMSKIIRQQIKDDYLPKINEIDILDYDVIFIGSAIWNFSISLPLKSFIKNNNFENKIIIPFVTYSGGANRNKVYNEIKNLTRAKDVRKILFMYENGIFLTKEQIIKWLNMLQ